MTASPQLDREETAVFKACYDLSLNEETDIIEIRDIAAKLQESGLTNQEIQDSIAVLLGQNLLDDYLGKRASGNIHVVRTNVYGFVRYANQFIPNIDQIYNSTLDAIVNGGLVEHADIATLLNKPKMLIEYVFDLLKHNRLINAAQPMGGDYFVTEVTAEARKLAKKLKAQEIAPVQEAKTVDTNTISQKEDKRNRVLVRMYLETNGDVFHAVPDEVIIEKEGVSAEELNRDIQPYLVNEHYIKYMTFGTTAIDYRGIKKVEEHLLTKAVANPEPPSIQVPSSPLIDVLNSRMLFIPDEEYYPLIKPLVGFKEDIEAKLKHFPFKKNVFLMMKFRESNKLLGEFMIQTLKEHGLNGVRADQTQWNITRDVYNPLAVLYCCKYGIALFDEREEDHAYSPNVAYELGIMHYQHKACLILRHSSLPQIPFDFIKDLYRTYNKELEVQGIIKDWINEISG